MVILSPASTSFDRFANFMERGRVFKDLVNALLRKNRVRVKSFPHRMAGRGEKRPWLLDFTTIAAV